MQLVRVARFELLVLYATIKSAEPQELLARSVLAISVPECRILLMFGEMIFLQGKLAVTRFLGRWSIAGIGGGRRRLAGTDRPRAVKAGKPRKARYECFCRRHSRPSKPAPELKGYQLMKAVFSV